jgi:protein-tyrosine kinase
VSDARNTSIIEQAAKRLAELKHAGVETPEAHPIERARVDSVPNVERAVGKLAAVEPGLFRQPPGSSPHAAGAAPQRPAPHRPAPRQDAPMRPVVVPPPRSKKVDIDLAALEAAGYISPTQIVTRLSEEMRVIKRPLLHHMQPRDGQSPPRGNLVMVTSSTDGEGKTFTAINLALSIAMEMDRTVLLVDADVARPTVLQRLGLPVSKGLLDILSDDGAAVSDCILRTNIEKLTLLPSGTAHLRATELLASDAMCRLVEELAQRYPDRVVVFDAPPLLASTESRVLATHMGQVLVVVEADRTAQATVNEALATVENCPLVYTVLNKARKPAGDGAYGPYRH